MLSAATSSTGPKENERGLTILQASYGLQGNFMDVTTDIQGLVTNGELNFTVSPQSIGVLDNAPGVIKDLQIQYTINKGRKNKQDFKDGDQVVISAPDVPKDKNDKSYTYVFFQAIWYSIIIFLVGSFALDSKRTGELVFGSTALGWIFAAMTIGTFGHFHLFVLPIFVIFIAWWSS